MLDEVMGEVGWWVKCVEGCWVMSKVLEDEVEWRMKS